MEILKLVIRGFFGVIIVYLLLSVFFTLWHLFFAAFSDDIELVCSRGRKAARVTTILHLSLVFGGFIYFGMIADAFSSNAQVLFVKLVLISSAMLAIAAVPAAFYKSEHDIYE